MFRILLLMTLIPTIEILLMFDIHDWFASQWGADTAILATVGVTLLTGFIGARLARQQGFRILGQVQSQLATGQMPGEALVEGAMVLVGGVLLLTPGYFTDMMGFILVMPWSRGLIRQQFVNLLGRASSRVTVVSYQSHPRPSGRDRVVRDNVLDVEAIDI